MKPFRRLVVTAVTAFGLTVLPAHARQPDSSVAPNLLMTDATHGWLLRSGQVSVTQDGGLRWRLLPTFSSLLRMTSATATRVQVIGTNGHSYVLLSVDAHNGQSRQLSVLPGGVPGTLDVSDTVSQFGPNRWWNLTLGEVSNSKYGMLFHSKDEGRHWYLLNFDGLTSQKLPRTGSGIVPQGFQSRRVFVSPTRGFFTSAGNTEGSLLIQSTKDGGRTWAPHMLLLADPKAVSGPPSLFWFGETGVVSTVALGETPEVSPALETFITLNNGASWQRQPAFQIGGQVVMKPYPVFFSSAQNGWAWLSGQLYRTCDAGKSWQATASRGLPAGQTVQQLQFVGAATGWLLSGTTLFNTLDGGATWQQVRQAAFH